MRKFATIIVAAVLLASCGSGSVSSSLTVTHSVGGAAGTTGASLAAGLASAVCAGRVQPVASSPAIHTRIAFVSLPPRPFSAVTTVDGK